jgi:hypothetical protein
MASLALLLGWVVNSYDQISYFFRGENIRSLTPQEQADAEFVFKQEGGQPMIAF